LSTYAVLCSSCGSELGPRGLTRRCPRCGGIPKLQLERPVFRVNRSKPGIWRYSSMLPAFSCTVSKGEGLTPIVNVNGVLIKNERLNPTGSYADRASAVISSYLRHVGMSSIKVLYEPGFARSISHYVGDDVNLAFYVDDLLVVDVDELIDIARRGEVSACKSGESFIVDYVSALTVEGLKTIVFEVAERGLRVESIVVPAKTGVLAFSLGKGLRDLEEAGLEVNLEVIAAYPKSFNPPQMPDRRVKLVGVSHDELLGSYRLLVKKGVFTAPLSATAFHVAASVKSALAILTLGYKPRPKRRRRWLSERLVKVLEQLGSATAYEIWKHMPDASLRGVYKAIRTLVSEGVVCEEPSTKGRRKVMLYKLCS